MKWKNKLTKKELRHLKNDAGVKTLAEPCWECREIAKKLGF